MSAVAASNVEMVKVRIVKPGLLFHGFLEVSPNTTFSELFYQILDEVRNKQIEKNLPVQMGSITCGPYIGTRKKNDEDKWIIEVKDTSIGRIIEEPPTVGQIYHNYPSTAFSYRKKGPRELFEVLSVFVFNEDRREQHSTPPEDEQEEDLLPRAKKLKF